jgi:hypothetical protein
MPRVTYLNVPRESQMLDYALNIYKNDQFIVCIRYEGFSGTDVHDTVKYLKKNEYRIEEGFDIRW